MFEKVLIPTDLSDASDAVAGRIGELPGVREVVIFHIREAGQSAPSDEALRRLEETVKRQGISAAVLVTDAAGEPIPALILKAATDTGADLIAMATRAQGMMRNLFAEKTTMEVLRGARVHVLIVPAGELDTPFYVRLLFPTDLSAPAPEIRSLLDSSAGEAVVLHVADPGRAGADKEAGERLAAMKADLAETGREITALVRLGIPGSVICDAMNELHPSLVVIPRIGKRDAAGSAPLGSVTEAVVGCARAPVLVLAVPIRLRIAARELRRDEFVLAEEIWTDYHQLKGSLPARLSSLSPDAAGTRTATRSTGSSHR
jgi:nucleotide-binding universal stress UspA family protein